MHVKPGAGLGTLSAGARGSRDLLAERGQHLGWPLRAGPMAERCCGLILTLDPRP